MRTWYHVQKCWLLIYFLEGSTEIIKYCKVHHSKQDLICGTLHTTSGIRTSPINTIKSSWLPVVENNTVRPRFKKPLLLRTLLLRRPATSAGLFWSPGEATKDRKYSVYLTSPRVPHCRPTRRPEWKIMTSKFEELSTIYKVSLIT